MHRAIKRLSKDGGNGRIDLFPHTKKNSQILCRKNSARTSLDHSLLCRSLVWRCCAETRRTKFSGAIKRLHPRHQRRERPEEMILFAAIRQLHPSPNILSIARRFQSRMKQLLGKITQHIHHSCAPCLCENRPE